MEKLLIIDGNAMLHRAYHAYPPLTNTKGEVINAVYGFFTLLLRVLEDQTPEYLAICFDRPGPTIRQSWYAGYHAHRPELPDDFVPQILLVHALLEKMRVSIFSVDGYEADDVIGTIAAKALTDSGSSLSHVSDDARLAKNEPSTAPRSLSERRQQSQGIRESLSTSAFNSSESEQSPPISNALNVVILTGDRDLLQLVNPHVRILMPLLGMTKTAWFDEAAVLEKYGVSSSQFVDYKALIGDASDGYPGVTGIGPKTAMKLLQEYHTFENLYKHLQDLPEKLAMKLATDAEQAALAKKLAKIMTDVPVSFALASCSCSRFDAAALRKEFIGHGFKTLTARLDTFFHLVPDENKQEQLGLL